MLNMIETKNKIKNSFIKNEIGFYAMAAASLFGVMEMPAHYLRDNLLPVAKIAVAETVTHRDSVPTPIQREKAETGAEFVSYSESQRTPGRTGNV